MFSRVKVGPVPEVGDEAPEFSLPSAQGGQLRLSMRTVRGPVVVAFYRPGDEEDVEYFKALAGKEEEIHLASGSVVAIGVAEPTQARNFARASGLKSYVLYDYAKVASSQWGLLERDRKEGDYARPAVFVVGPDHDVAQAWVGQRPDPDEVLARVSEITGLPKPPEEPKKVEEKHEDAEKREDTPQLKTVLHVPRTRPARNAEGPSRLTQGRGRPCGAVLLVARPEDGRCCPPPDEGLDCVG